jgi:hypothetical protein
MTQSNSFFAIYLPRNARSYDLNNKINDIKNLTLNE